MICRDRPRDVAVLAGDDAATLAVLAMGGDGVVSVAGNQVPGAMAALCDAARAGDWDEARRLHARWLPLFRANFQGAPNPVPAKAALLAMGLIERDDVRAPLLPLAAGPRARLLDLLRTLGLVDGGGRLHADRAEVRRGPGDGRGGCRMTALDVTGSGLEATILDDLDAGRRRAAFPDPAAPGGWRVDPDVKAAILARFRDRATTTWDLGGALAFRDRAGVPVKRLLDGPEAEAALEAGRPWRIVPGGTSVRAGAYLGPGVVVLPPSFVNVGAWIGEDTMVDSHVLVGSCAQVGARVHLSAGVTIGGVLEPAGARPVIVEDGAFVGAGSSLLEGVLVGAGAVIGAGRRPDGDLAPVRPRPRTRPDRHAGRSARRPARGRRRPGQPDAGRAVRGGARPGRRGRAAGQGPRRGDRRPGRDRGGAAMSLVRPPGPPPVRPAEPPARRGRPPARNEILRAGRLGGLDPAELAAREGTPFYAYDLDVVGRQVDALRRRLPSSVDLAYAVKANPSLAVLRRLAGLGLGADVASGGELRQALRAGFVAAEVVVTGPGKRDEELPPPSTPACAR